MADGDIKLSSSPNVDKAFVEKDGKNLRATLQETPNGTLELSDSPNVDTGYMVDSDGKKHRVHLVATPTGTLETPDGEASDKGYIIDGDGKKHRVSLVTNVSGGGSTINNQDITITANGTYTADEGYTGIGTATVNVSGGGSKYGATADTFLGDIDADGVLQNANTPTNLTFTGVKNMSYITSGGSTLGVLFRRFQNLNSIRVVSFPDWIHYGIVSQGAVLQNAFYNSSITKLLCPKVLRAVNNDFNSVCTNCPELEEINFDELSSISYENSVFANAFNGCTKLKSARFPCLITCNGSYVFQNAFANSGIEHLYFYFRNNSSSVGNGIFASMLTGVTGCTIHLPSNLNPSGGSTVISSMSGYPNFGGTSTVLSYDLPRTLRLNNMYWRNVLNDTATSCGWVTGVQDKTWVYTSGTTEPSVGDNFYRDAACTIVLGTISSLTE